MSLVSVQCKGSGQKAHVGLNAKRAVCAHCHLEKDLRSDGKFRKHMRQTRTRNLR